MKSSISYVILALYLYMGSFTTVQEASAGLPIDPSPVLSLICGGQHEIFLGPGTAPNCDQHCATLCEPCDVVYIQPPSGCYCAPGFSLYLCMGSFTTVQQTTTSYPRYPYDPLPTAPTCYGQYEIYLGQGEAPNCDPICATLCQPCDIVFIQPPSGCYCAPGFCRNNNYDCIPISDKPVCYGQYEVYLGQGEAPNCDQHCATLCQPCGVVYKRPPFGCYCAPGYCRNENSVYHMALHSDNQNIIKQICGTNEVFIRDYDGFTYDVTCSSLCDPKPLPLPSIDIDYGRPSIGIPPPCSGGSCYCKPGYVRDDNYVRAMKYFFNLIALSLVLIINFGSLKEVNGCACQEPTCGPNEVYLKQGEAPNCDTVCSELCEPCAIVFIQAPFGCYCKPSFARDENEPACSGPNEVYLKQGEAPNCDPACSTICEPCTIVFIQAPFGCYCKPGYARDSNNKHITAEFQKNITFILQNSELPMDNDP
ncbi:uncharacterized protein LOC129616153 [Condylostylus longicornis]|uniref:uncharacterized protein LOC129616153 n=1 Tax=Condylostylus longicornis TaxID=2530218 RepID=UPI00244E3BDC|nr:uncharacterized protein LOC129616153 [Condylostylus longicornis]